MQPPVACPVCGAYSLTQDGQSSALLAVADVLVIKALEQLGKFIIRHGRSRYRELHARPPHLAHTIEPPAEQFVGRALEGAWDVVPAMLDSHGCCDITSVQITRMLDSYVHDLVITGTPHRLSELAYRFETQLGLPVYLKSPPDLLETKEDPAWMFNGEHSSSVSSSVS